MQDQKDYTKDIVEIRSMMERSSKFLSLSGWAGIMAGIYALSGIYIAGRVLNFNPKDIVICSPGSEIFSPDMIKVVLLASMILIFAIGTAILLSYKKAKERNEPLWNPVAKRLLVNMAVPLITGGLLILLLISRGLIVFIAPFTLIFYGLALYSASKFTYNEVKSLGLIEILLGLVSACFVQYALIIWALGFGVLHIVYGIYMHYKYER